MRKFFSFLAVAVLSLSFSLTSFAAPSPAPAKAALDPATQAELAFNKKVTDFYKQDAAYRKESWAKRTDFLKQMADLRNKKKTANDADKKKMDAEISKLKVQSGQLAEEMAKREIAAADFGIEIAQHRKERASKNLERIQAQNKK